MSMKTVIDAEGLILGRMASIIAKRLLTGEYIEVVNAQSVVVSGKRLKIIGDYKEFLSVGGKRKGPIHHRVPNSMVRRTIRGMLPYRKPKGRDAYKRLRVYIGVPEELIDSDKESIPEAHMSKLNNRFITIGEIAEQIGWRKRGMK